MRKVKQLAIPGDERIGQRIFNFLRWLKTEKGFKSHTVIKEGTYVHAEISDFSAMADPFNIEDDRFLELWEEYNMLVVH